MRATLSASSAATLVWGVLAAATVTTWFLARGQDTSPTQTAALVMVIAAMKARLIVLHFMGLKTAPLPWRLIFEGWVFAVTGFILIGCLSGSRFV